MPGHQVTEMREVMSWPHFSAINLMLIRDGEDVNIYKMFISDLPYPWPKVR